MKMSSALCLAVVLVTPASAQSVVGYVAKIDGDPNKTQLLRSKSEGRPLRLAEYIFAGDTVVTPPSVRVRIDTKTGSVDPCSSSRDGECRYLFSPATEGPSASEMGERLSAMLSWFGGQPRNLVVRSGDAPIAKYGRGAVQKIASGRRSLWLGWAQGEAPFRVSVVAAGRTIAEAEAQSRSVDFREIEIPIGKAEARILDARGRALAINLIGVTEILRVPELGQSAVNSAHAELLKAAWLAAQEQGAWALEAAQFRAAESAADTFRLAIISGDRP